MRNLWFGIALFGLSTQAYADQKDFTVNARPIFESVTTWANAPIAIEIENKGPDARGQILVSGEGVTTRYPIELPTSSKKRIIVYLGGSQFGMSPEFVFDSDQGRFEIPYVSRAVYNYGNANAVALISDNSGELGFLTQQTNIGNRNRPPTQFTDAYCKPEDCPERPLGLQGLAGVILGEGSERLSDNSVAALKSYVMTGGTLVFIGGASAPTLSDPRWQNMLPATGFRIKSIVASDYFPGVIEAVTIASGTPIPSARITRSRNGMISAERAFGIGRVNLLTYNPFEDPISRWKGRQGAFLQAVRAIDFQRANQFLNEFGVSNRSEEYGYSSPPMSTMSPRSYTSFNPPQRQDPFSVELPAASKVFWILAAFFVVVVPINFIVLRKLGKGEWAWLTAPVISLAFAGIFLNQASDLYSARLSTATNGVVIVQEGMPEGMFIGATQMFFPNGGSYDLKLKNVDQLGTGGDQYNPYQNRETRTQIDPIDNGTILVPNLRAANLAFEEIGYRQRIPDTPRLQVKSVPQRNNQVRVTIKNFTNSVLNNGMLIVAGRTYGLQSIAPGGESSMTVNSQPIPSGQNGDFLQSFSGRHQVAIVASDISNLKPGPQLGNQVALRSSVRLVYVSPLFGIPEAP